MCYFGLFEGFLLLFVVDLRGSPAELKECVCVCERARSIKPVMTGDNDTWTVLSMSSLMW